jgi:hypothetical protein
MNENDVILYSTPAENAHEPHLRSLLVTPRVGFQSTHNIDHVLTLTRLPCDKETAEKWVTYIRECMKDRFVWAEIKEEPV